MNMTEDIPVSVGSVPLECESTVTTPRRTPTSLHLPRRAGMNFHLVKEETQFIVRYPVLLSEPVISQRTFFGWMDESPFLTPIDLEPYNALVDHGEQAFFESLVPKAIKKLVATFAGNPRRQGDIWSFKLPWTWNELPLHFRAKNRKQRLKFRSHFQRILQLNQVSYVSGTNHTLMGRLYAGARIIVDNKTLVRTGIGEGVLRAPDHADQILDGPHALARTPHLKPIMIPQRRLG